MRSQTITEQQLSRILWIGGSPCSGKSTIARRIATRFSLRLYVCDDEVERHGRLVTPDQQPVFSRLMSLDCDGLWMRPVAQQIDEEVEFYREEFSLILDDLAVILADAEPGATPVVVAEGAALLPSLLAGLGVARSRAISIVPTPPFQRAHYERRAWRHDVLRECTDRVEAWDRWMARDAGFAERVLSEAAGHDYPSIVVDGSRTVDENEAAVVAHVGLT